MLGSARIDSRFQPSFNHDRDPGFWMLDAGSKILIVIVILIMISLPLLLSAPPN